MQQNNGLKFSRDRKNYIDFQLDVFGGGGWGYFENVQWTLCVKESICVRPPKELPPPLCWMSQQRNRATIAIHPLK